MQQTVSNGWECVYLDKNSPVKEYYDNLSKMSNAEFQVNFPYEWESVVKELKNPNVFKNFYNKNLTGIFRKTPGRVKSSSGVRFGFGGGTNEE